VMVCLNNRFRPALLRLKRVADEGLLGRLYYARATWLRRAGIPVSNPWFTDRRLSGGGVLIDLGVHMLDLALWIMGYPTAVSVSGATYAQFGPLRQGVSEKYGCPGGLMPEGQLFDVEDAAMGLVRFANGASVDLELSWAAHTGIDDDIALQLLGSQGGADLATPDYVDEGALRLYLGSGKTAPGAAAESEHGLTGHAAVIDHFVQCILRDEEPTVRISDMVALTKVIDALYRSAAEGREVRIA
jgi:predicted dehydrogenase